MGELEPKVSIGKIVARSMIGQLPILGPVVNEILTEIIPDRRVERLTSLFERLEERISKIESPSKERFTEAVFVDLLEDGMLAAARATTPERLDHIAALLSDGLTGTEARAIERKFLLGLLSQLNDVEVLLLAQKGLFRRDAHLAFNKRHAQALGRPHPTLRSPLNELERAAISKGYDNHLEALGLVTTRVRPPKKGQTPEFEHDGSLKGTQRELSGLGRALLKAIGQPAEIDQLRGPEKAPP